MEKVKNIVNKQVEKDVDSVDMWVTLLSKKIDRLVLHIKKYNLQDGARSILINKVVQRKILRENKDPMKVRGIIEELRNEKQKKKEYWEMPAFLRKVKN